MKDTITLDVFYDDTDSIIFQALKIPLTVHQLTSILRFHDIDISPMRIRRRLEFLEMIGKIGKKKKNSHVFEYYYIK